jgi:hypothetical protein
MESESKNREPGNSKPKRNRKDKRNRSKKPAKKNTVAKDAETPKKPKNSLLPQQNKKPYHSNLPQLPVKRVTEPQEICKICDQVIEGIACAITHPEGGFCHFDCVLEQIAESEGLKDNQKVSYIGRGTFAVVQTEEDGSFSFVKRIVYENSEAFTAMKKYVESAKQ